MNHVLIPRFNITVKTALLVLGVFIAELLFLFYLSSVSPLSYENAMKTPIPNIPSPTPTDEPFRTYTLPTIEKKKEYAIVMVGDSMTHALGPHGGTLYEYLNDAYKPSGQGVLIDNYASGSTNILTLEEAMNKETTYWDATFKPLLSRDFDIILIESFGYNPLSEFTPEEGIKKHNEVLDRVIPNLIKTHPKSIIIFVATIAPNKENYAKPIIKDITTEERVKQAEERIRYIQNHMDYAKSHNIPLIDIYSKSLDETGSGNMKYINPDDYIHPSFEGVDFIGHEITNFLVTGNYLPK